MDEKQARETLESFFQLSDAHIQRFVAVRAQDQAEKEAVEREAAEEICKEIFDVLERVSEATAEMPLLEPIRNELTLIPTSDGVDAIMQFTQFREYLNNPTMRQAFEKTEFDVPL